MLRMAGCHSECIKRRPCYRTEAVRLVAVELFYALSCVMMCFTAGLLLGIACFDPTQFTWSNLEMLKYLRFFLAITNHGTNSNWLVSAQLAANNTR